MRTRIEPALGCLALFLCTSCPILGRDEESFAGSPESKDRVPVVDDVGGFDPSEAVDDDDGAVVVDSDRDPTDAPAFSEDAETGAQPEEAAENEREGDAEPGAKGERVADDAEAEARERARGRAVAHAAESGDEDAQKVEADRNPPPEPTVESEPETTKVLDFGLETLVVAVLAALVSSVLVFARSHPRTVAIGVFLLAAVSAFVVYQGE